MSPWTTTSHAPCSSSTLVTSTRPASYLEELIRQDPIIPPTLQSGPLLRGPRPAREGHGAAATLLPACAGALARLRGAGHRLLESRRPAECKEIHHAGSGRRSQEPGGPQEPGRHLRQGGRQPEGPAPVLLRSIPRTPRPSAASPSLTWSWEISSRSRSISRK